MSADRYFAQGLAAHRAGRLADAQRHYAEALAAAPIHADALHYFGVLLVHQGRYDAAEQHFAAALARSPQARMHVMRAAALLELNRQEEALAELDAATRLAPGNADAGVMRGSVLVDLGRMTDAIAEFDRVLRFQPRHALAHCRRGVAQMRIRRIGAALDSFTAAIALQPDYFEALSLRGNAYMFCNDPGRALLDYMAALAVDPASAGTFYNRGNALNNLKRPQEALADYERAFALDPSLPHLEGALLHARMHVCDWVDFEARTAALLAHVGAGAPVAMPFHLTPLPASPSLQRLCAENFVARRYPAAAPRPRARQDRSRERIRIAYLSGGLQLHATSLLMVEIFEHHDRGRFETIALSFSPDDGSAMRHRLAAAFDQFLDVSGEDDETIAARLEALNIDIAIDLDGFTLVSRTAVIARCPAVVAPPGSEEEFSECVVRLPGSYQPNSEREIAPPPSRSDCGLPDQGFVFCAFNASFKITPDVFSVWMRLLRAVQGSVLWLLETSAPQKANLRREAKARGVDEDRLVFAPRLDPDAHLARHAHADLFLDTRCYNAHTTASDALGCGVPLLTCVGPAFAGRVAASLLTVCGLPELITHSLEDYESMALKLARDPVMLADLKERLRQGRSTLFDTARTTRSLERAYQIMWERAQQGLPPEGFDV